MKTYLRTTYDKIIREEWVANRKLIRALVKKKKKFALSDESFLFFNALLNMINAVEDKDFLQGDNIHETLCLAINQIAEGAEQTPECNHSLHEELRSWIFSWSMDFGGIARKRGWLPADYSLPEFSYVGNKQLFDVCYFSPYALARIVEYELGKFLFDNSNRNFGNDAHHFYHSVYTDDVREELKRKFAAKQSSEDFILPSPDIDVKASDCPAPVFDNATDGAKKISLATDASKQNNRKLSFRLYQKRSSNTMPKLSSVTIEQLKAVTADELVAHGIIHEAPNHSGKRGYACPLCGSGSGQNHNGRGDGAGEFDDNNRFFCHACGNEDVGRHKLSPIDLFAVSRNLTHENFAEQCRQMAYEFGVAVDYEEMKFLVRTRRRSSRKIEVKPPPVVNYKELELIRQDLYETPDSNLKTFVEKKCGGLWRGFDADFLIRHKCKYIERWTPIKSRLEGKYCTPTPRVLVPAGSDNYLARFVGDLDIYDASTRKFIEDNLKLHAGTKKLFNVNALKSDKPIFCVEGYIDAMSIELANFNAVALGAASRGDLLIDAVKSLDKKPQVIILLDSDEQGRKHAPKLYNALIDIGCPAVVRFLSEEESKIDCNEILTSQGVDNLRGILEKIYDDSLAELSAAEEEIAASNEIADSDFLSDDEREFYFGGLATDLANARRLEIFCGDRVHWLTDEERWITYANGIWRRGSDTSAAVLPFAAKLADTLLANSEMVTENQKKKAEAIAFKFQKRDTVSAAITMLKSCDSILITADDLDNHKNLLNCLNGVVDLETRKFYQHDSKLLITQQCRVHYDEKATSELVDNFFKAIQPDEETRRGLLRWLGYCLSGEVKEEKFMIWTGGGGNGKGVLSATVLELFGTYGVGLAPTTLLKSNKPFDADKPTTALNGLEFSRFAISEEMPADGELEVSLIKNLSGGDRINLRRLHAEYRTVRPTVKLNLSGNYTPKIENVHDDGLLRRMLNMPFLVKFGTPENPADYDLKKKLLAPENLSAFLRLLVAESGNWYRDGLIISSQMKQETKRHLEQNDFISDFISDNYERGDNLSVKAKDFVEALKREYPRECGRFKRNDLIRLISETSGISYSLDRTKTRVFKGIGKPGAPTQQSFDDFGGEPVDPNDIPFD